MVSGWTNYYYLATFSLGCRSVWVSTHACIVFAKLKKVNWNATVRPRGPSGAVLWGVSTALILWGFSRVGKYNKDQAAEKRLEREARYFMAPILQEEADRAYLDDRKKLEEFEASVMGKPFEPVYKSGRWVAPNLKPLDKNLGK